MVVYIHIPFCKNICSYCDFCKMYYDKKFIDGYLSSLENEIKERYKGEKINSIFIGGGTPNVLDNDDLTRLLEITKLFDISSLNEFTVECNIDLITRDNILIMKQYGVNRISIGVESFDREILEILGRKHDKNEVFSKIKLVKEYFSNINIDLIYAVTSDICKVKRDIEYFLELDVPHISCYSLIVEDNTLLKINGYKKIDSDVDYEMYDMINGLLTNNGYIHYEISNYAKDGYQSIHNLTYWNNLEYYGFGLSSVSYLNNKRMVNTVNFKKYLNGEYISDISEENIDIRMENEIMLGLRKLEGINLMLFENKYGKKLEDVYNIDDLVREGVLVTDNGYLRINEDYIYVSNEVIIKIIG